MTPLTPAVADVPTGGALTFQRPAELVEVSERLYQHFFAVGLWVASACTALSMVTAVLEPAASVLAGFAACAVNLAWLVASARRPIQAYRLLSRRPWTLAVAAAVLAITAVGVGPQNDALFVPMVVVLGVGAIVTSRSVLVLAGLIAAAGFAAPRLTDGHANIGGALVVIVPPLLFWLNVDRIAGFALRLNQRLAEAAAGAPHPRPTAGTVSAATDGVHEPAAGPDRAVVRNGLPNPASVTVDGVRLTSRQLQVVLLACEGLQHAAIASCLGIRPAMVGRHLHEARRRTGSASTQQLVVWAHRSGLVPTAAAPPHGP